MIAHEFAHALQIRASGGKFVAPVIREICAFIGEAALLSHILRENPTQYDHLVQAWRQANHRYFGRQRIVFRRTYSERMRLTNTPGIILSPDILRFRFLTGVRQNGFGFSSKAKHPFARFCRSYAPLEPSPNNGVRRSRDDHWAIASQIDFGSWTPDVAGDLSSPAPYGRLSESSGAKSLPGCGPARAIFRRARRQHRDHGGRSTEAPGGGGHRYCPCRLTHDVCRASSQLHSAARSYRPASLNWRPYVHCSKQPHGVCYNERWKRSIPRQGS